MLRIFDDLTKNQKTYDEGTSEGDNEIPAIVARELIATNNGIRLNEISPSLLLKANTSLLKLDGLSLMDYALLWGDFDAVKAIIESEIEIRSDAETIQRYLSKLFIEYPLINSCFGDHIEYDKSSDNLINIYHYLTENIAKNNPAWTDTAMMNHFFVEAAKGDVTTVLALLSLGHVGDINTVDKTGKTALYYLTLKGMTLPVVDEQDPLLSDTVDLEDEIQRAAMMSDDFQTITTLLIAQLKKEGAEFSSADRKALTQPDFAKNLLQAIMRNDQEVIDRYLRQIHEDDQLLSQMGFKECLEAAIEKNDVKTVKSLLGSSYASKIKLGELKLAITTSDEMIYALADQHKTVDVSERFEKRLRQAAHRIGISGAISVMTHNNPPFGNRNKILSFEGDDLIGSRSALHKVLADYSEKNDKFKPIAAAASFACNLAELSPVNIDSDKTALLSHQYYSAGHGMVLVSTWIEHAVGISVKYDEKSDKTYIAVSNRGNGNLQACLTKIAERLLKDRPQCGTVVYRLDGKLSQSFFDKIPCYDNTIQFASDTDFNQALNEELKDAKPVAVLPAQPQKHGTCSYVNPKRSIEGLLLIEAICAGKPVDSNTLADAYNQYKLFSVDDKQQAVYDIIALHKSMAQNPDAIPIEIELLHKFMIKIIMSHHSTKYNEIELAWAKELYRALPNEHREKLSSVFPELASETYTVKDKMTLFSQQRDRVRNIKITGELENIILFSNTLNNLQEYLRRNDLNKDVKEIQVTDSKIVIVTQNDQKLKYRLRDDVFQKELGAEITNVRGEYKFIVNNPDKLRLPTMVPPRK